MLDVSILGDESLLVGRIRGILDLRAATKLIELVEIKEDELQHGFDCVCDLTHLEEIQLTEKQVQSLAIRRRNHNPIRVKSVFIAAEPLTKSIACMYQVLVASDRITVGVFDSYESAAAWLQVTAEKRKPWLFPLSNSQLGDYLLPAVGQCNGFSARCNLLNVKTANSRADSTPRCFSTSE